jgi:hypothetical protein
VRAGRAPLKVANDWNADIKFKQAELKGEPGDILDFHDSVTDQE